VFVVVVVVVVVVVGQTNKNHVVVVVVVGQSPKGTWDMQLQCNKLHGITSASNTTKNM
jgi:hypothetical protein